MKTVNIQIELFEFKELELAARLKAINEHCFFMDEVNESESDEKEVIENIEVNEYLFFKSGELAHTCQYVENHPTKAGKHEFIFQDKTYNII